MELTHRLFFRLIGEQNTKKNLLLPEYECSINFSYDYVIGYMSTRSVTIKKKISFSELANFQLYLFLTQSISYLRFIYSFNNYLPVFLCADREYSHYLGCLSFKIRVSSHTGKLNQPTSIFFFKYFSLQIFTFNFLRYLKCNLM